MKPLTLQQTAARQAVQVYPPLPLNVSKPMVFHAAMQKKGRQLLNFIEEQGGLFKLKENLNNEDMYQHIVFHLVREMETCSLEESKEETLQLFKEELKKLKNQEELLQCENKMDDTIQNLGLDFTRYIYRVNNEQYFIKKRHYHCGYKSCFHYFDIAPVNHPKVLKAIFQNQKNKVDIHLMHASDRKLEDKFPFYYNNNETFYQTIGITCKNIQNYFFQQLMTMTHSFNRHQHHRVIAYAIDLLFCPKFKFEHDFLDKDKQKTVLLDIDQHLYKTSKRMKSESQLKDKKEKNPDSNLKCVNFKDDPYFARYFVYIWGMLAVALAAVGIEPKFALLCLENAEKLTRCLSEHIEVLLYKQKVFARFGWFQNETHVFQELYTIVPRMSIFYQKTVFCHVWAAVAEIENLIVHALLIKKVTSNKDFRDSLVKKFIEITKNNAKTAFVVIHNLQKLLAEMLWKNQNNGYYIVKKLQVFTAIVELFQIILEETLNYSMSSTFFIKTVAHKLFDLNGKHFSPFLELFSNNNYSFEDYETELNYFCSDILSTVQTIESIEEAHCLFTQILLILCFKSLNISFNTKMNNLVRKSNVIFEKYNHPRKILTSKFFETELQKLPEKLPPTFVNLDDFSTTGVTLDSFLQDKKIVHFIEMGSKFNPSHVYF